MKKLNAFTLIEIILVITLTSIVGVIAVASIVSYHVNTVLDSELKELVSNIQLARQNALGNDNSNDYSIKFLPESYILFPGAAYSSNNVENRTYTLDSIVVVSTTFTNDIITFSNFTGRVSEPGSISVSAGGINREVTINSLGIVEDIL
ncbi:MAG: type II secretion system protein [Candidatus Doudnabacteria bacterium]|nr:type II secretion system protein [Candidatus Doudnabacteria bacterium]